MAVPVGIRQSARGNMIFDYKGESVETKWGWYGDLSPALGLVHAKTGEPVNKCSVYLELGLHTDTPRPSGYVWIKTWAENAELLVPIVMNKVVAFPEAFTPMPYGNYSALCKILDPDGLRIEQPLPKVYSLR